MNKLILPDVGIFEGQQFDVTLVVDGTGNTAFTTPYRITGVPAGYLNIPLQGNIGLNFQNNTAVIPLTVNSNLVLNDDSLMNIEFPNLGLSGTVYINSITGSFDTDPSSYRLELPGSSIFEGQEFLIRIKAPWTPSATAINYVITGVDQSRINVALTGTTVVTNGVGSLSINVISNYDYIDDSLLRIEFPGLNLRGSVPIINTLFPGATLPGVSPPPVSPPPVSPPPVSPPPVSPPPVSPPPLVVSPNGTVIYPGTGAIVDNQGAVWTVTNDFLAAGLYNRIVKRNGLDAGYSANVSLVLWYNNVIYQQNDQGDWYRWISPTDPPWEFVSTGDPRVPPSPSPTSTPSPNGTTIPSATQIVDNNGGIWTVSGGVIYLNGSLAGYSANVTTLLWYNNTIYQSNSEGGWWSWTGTTWQGISGDPRVSPSPPVSPPPVSPPPVGPNDTLIWSGSTPVPQNFGGMHFTEPLSATNMYVGSECYRSVRSHDFNNCFWAKWNTAFGQYNWTNVDAWLDYHAAARGKEIFWCFFMTPQWASSNPNGPDPRYFAFPGGMYAPSDWNSGNNYLKTAVTALLAHAKSRGTPIKIMELWNEPSWTDNNGQTPTDYSFYFSSSQTLAAMQIAFYEAVKAFDTANATNTTVIMGAFSNYTDSVTTLFNSLKNYGKTSWQQFCDGASYHGYDSYPQGSSVYGGGAITIQTMHQDFRNAINAAGFNGSTIPVYNSEIGWGAAQGSAYHGGNIYWLTNATGAERAKILRGLGYMAAAIGEQRMMWYNSRGELIGDSQSGYGDDWQAVEVALADVANLGGKTITAVYYNTVTRDYSYRVAGADSSPSPSISPPVSPPPVSPPSSTVGPLGQNSAQWVLTFRDEFNGPGLDTNKWSDQIWYSDLASSSAGPNVAGGQGTSGFDGTVNYDVNNGGNSCLRIWPALIQSGPNAGKFFNRTIQSDNGFTQKYGYFEARMKMPVGRGCWPAFWLFGHYDGQSPSRPEIDILECYCGGDGGGANSSPGWANSSLQPTTWAPTFWSDPGNDNLRQSDGPYMETPGDILSADFHVYALKWGAGGVMTWYYDGQQIGSKTFTLFDRLDNHPLAVYFDLWFGSASGWANTGETPTGPSNSFEIDYVRAWRAV